MGKEIGETSIHLLNCNSDHITLLYNFSNILTNQPRSVRERIIFIVRQYNNWVHTH